MSAYAKHINTRSTPQTKPIPGRANMVPNDGGGYSFAVDCFTRLERFLILGCEGGHFQVGEEKLTVDNAQCVFECARQDTARTINLIVEISDSGRAPKNDPAIFALALLASMKEKSVSPLVVPTRREPSPRWRSTYCRRSVASSRILPTSSAP
jgi:60 kDa SS-A/Ro ribonucleoprotein